MSKYTKDGLSPYTSAAIPPARSDRRCTRASTATANRHERCDTSSSTWPDDHTDSPESRAIAAVNADVPG